LHGDNVDLRFTRVESVDETGIIGVDKQKDEFDVIIWATGFTGKYYVALSPFENNSNLTLATMPFQTSKIYGRGGEELHDRWAKQGAPSAYAGMMSPSFPNFCMIIPWPKMYH
jgi:cation diffusion facilitator CzcD-associated flavoprotein CzcO